MKKTLLLIVTAASLASCAANWTKPGGMPAMLASDQAQCHYEAEVATAPIRSPVEAGVKEGFMETACLRARGWANSK